MNHFAVTKRGLLGAALGVALVAGGVVGAMAEKASAGQNPHITFVSSPDPARVANSVSFTAGFAPIVKQTLPAVVNISTSKVVKVNQQMPQMFNDPFFRQFFGGDDRQFNAPREQREHSLGSGVIVSPDGYILTNNHVVNGASDIQVDLYDNRHFTAKLVGTDPRTDVAVIKINAGSLPAMPLGNSKNLEVGDFVLAIGEPFGLHSTVTMGIVSATGRTALGIEGPNSYENFIQTDAAINPGNSGGALVDIHGELVGINTAILTDGGGEEAGNRGVGFAVPIDMARNVMTQLVEHGKVTRGYIGAFIEQLNPSLAKQFNASSTNGALISSVEEGGPASKAGLRGGDVIVAMNGQTYTDYSELRNAIAMNAPGSVVRLKIERDGRAMDVPVTLGRLPDTEAANNDNDQSGADEGGATESGSGTLSGVEVENLTSSLAQQLGYSPTASGVIVSNVSPDSAAAEANPPLQRGLLIIEVNHHPVHNVQEFRREVSQAGHNSILLLVRVNRQSGGGTFFTVVQPQSQQ
ncbi:MAG TPA: DegQ family serine endoprotease [Candidatus Sulfotelmatobacter sp.]|nr:DegQ family serine endoprotease [Candidatus Sulfotelmatobacter sp.]